MEKIVLHNGLRLLVEYMPHLRSVSTGIWVDTGSAHEQEGQFGISHLLEHMMFKGTTHRSALEISSAMDNVGGVLNAFTGREQTCYYTRCLDEQVELALDLLADMYQNSLFDAAELEREKNVVIEEINMYEDTPDERVLDLFAQTLWPQHGYGRSISGSAADVAALDRQQVVDYHHAHYTAGQTVLAMAGSIAPQRAAELVERLFTPHAAAAAPERLSPPLQSAGGDGYVAKNIEQTHVCLGFPAFSATDDDYYAASILNSAFGGSSSARLFQEIREKRGLSYGAYSYFDAFDCGGYFLAYASTQPANCAELIDVMAEEFHRLAEDGLTEDEVERSKQQLKGAMLLNMESTSYMMRKLGRHELTFGRVYSVDELVAQLMAVTPEDVRRVARRLVVPGKAVLAQVGPQQCPRFAGRLFA